MRISEPKFLSLLAREQVVGHPLVAGELAAGNMRNRAGILGAIDRLPQAQIAHHFEVRHFMELHKLYGRGVGFVDLHLLVSARLTTDTLLWTRDKRLHAIAAEMSIAFDEPVGLTQ